MWHKLKVSKVESSSPVLPQETIMFLETDNGQKKSKVPKCMVFVTSPMKSKWLQHV
jgi:hypothetical protein